MELSDKDERWAGDQWGARNRHRVAYVRGGVQSEGHSQVSQSIRPLYSQGKSPLRGQENNPGWNKSKRRVSHFLLLRNVTYDYILFTLHRQ